MRSAEFDVLFSDPTECFGKLYDPSVEECTVCVDVEACKFYLDNVAPVPKGEQPDPIIKIQEVPKSEDSDPEDDLYSPDPQTEEPPAKPAKPPKPVKPAKEPKPAKASHIPPQLRKGRPLDVYGYVIGSKSSFICHVLLENRYSREEIIAKMDERWPGQSNKATFNLFLSDFQKPIGTYSASRGISITTEQSGVLRVNGMPSNPH